jgi:hypothetical protein
MEWLPNIKRTKKKKSSAKQAGNLSDQVRPSSASPQSFCDIQNEGVSLSSADREWLQDQFASVKEQNRHIEKQNRQLKAQLDFLIKHTVKVDSSEVIHSGFKRPRLAQNNNWLPEAPRGHSQSADDSFKSFIDVMLANPNDESKAVDSYDYYDDGQGSNHHHHHRRDSHSVVASIINSLGSESGNLYSQSSCGRQNGQFTPHHNDDLSLTMDHHPEPVMQSRTEWVTRSNHLDDKMAGPGLVYSSQAAPPVTSSSSIIDPDEEEGQVQVPEWVAVVPPDGSVSPDHPHPSNHDEEHGNAFMDMTLVSAHLVESERGITIDDSAAQIIAEQQQHARQLSKRVMWAVAALVVAVIVSLTSTIIITRHEAPENAATSSSTEDKRPVDSTDLLEILEEIEEQNEYSTNSSESLNDESSSDFSPTRRWKSLNTHSLKTLKSNDQENVDISQGQDRSNLFNRDSVGIATQNATEQTLSQENVATTETRKNDTMLFTELSLTINGGIETFNCYHQ